jgi:hypothetical protein
MFPSIANVLKGRAQFDKEVQNEMDKLKRQANIGY